MLGVLREIVDRASPNAIFFVCDCSKRYRKSHVLIHNNDGTLEEMGALLRKAWSGVAERYDTTLPDLVARGGPGSLAARWVALCDSLGVPPHQQVLWWRTIRDCLCHRGRHHRTLDHLDALFRAFDACQAALETPSVVALALFFRDAALDPTAPPTPDDPGEAAALCRRFCAEAVSQDQRDVALTAAVLIESSFSTPLHQPPAAGEQSNVQGDIAFFLDVLAAPLANPPEEFSASCFAERLEGHRISEDLWTSTRPDMLESLYLSRPGIYNTDHFAHLESIARQNVTAEVTRLRAIIPDRGGPGVASASKLAHSSY